MAFGIIYCSTNLITGKCYIGQTIQKLNMRINEHYCRARKKRDNYCFYNTLNKYGKDNFKWEILCECDSRDELDEKEMYYIKELNTKIPNGYNTTDGGFGHSGQKLSEETKKKIGDGGRGKKMPLYAVEKQYKTYEITFPDGNIKIIKGLKTWCNENGLNYNAIFSALKRDTSYKGYKIKRV